MIAWNVLEGQGLGGSGAKTFLILLRFFLFFFYILILLRIRASPCLVPAGWIMRIKKFNIAYYLHFWTKVWQCLFFFYSVIKRENGMQITIHPFYSLHILESAHRLGWNLSYWYFCVNFWKVTSFTKGCKRRFSVPEMV